MGAPTIQVLFENISKLKVLIIGDIMLDSYIYGQIHRISPEAPVPIVSTSKKEQRLGGAGNVALNILALGATPVLCAVIGADPEGECIRSLLKKRGISGDAIYSSKNRITTVKERILAGSQHMLRVDREIEDELSNEDQSQVLQLIEKSMDQVQVVIFQDYDKGTINPEIISKTTEWAQNKEIPTVVDPKKRNFMHYMKASLFKPNFKELVEGSKMDVHSNNDQELKTAVATLREKLHFENALITLSEKGVYVEGKLGSHHIPAHIRSVSDVSGAGDTVISIAAIGMALNLPLKTTAELANLGGGLVCEHLGVVPIDKHDLMNEAIAEGILK